MSRSSSAHPTKISWNEEAWVDVNYDRESRSSTSVRGSVIHISVCMPMGHAVPQRLWVWPCDLLWLMEQKQTWYKLRLGERFVHSLVALGALLSSHMSKSRPVLLEDETHEDMSYLGRGHPKSTNSQMTCQWLHMHKSAQQRQAEEPTSWAQPKWPSRGIMS